MQESETHFLYRESEPTKTTKRQDSMQKQRVFLIGSLNLGLLWSNTVVEGGKRTKHILGSGKEGLGAQQAAE